ncbi:pseudaminic acid synthase [Clostridium botulinum]|uniref:pseudaminic acid synthase n=1 Tax=Clostridium botulinum TaxID=1491 RepID=UPI0013F13F01|nr:pseudaminic acid synthase [Clostridium botulinum]MCS6104155.1 pseudaminic acid synthase [Clostridium botulinum]MCS6107140.1 pseudaminic acid synthase [Clostridium botulinum]NFG23407.1 pseudaminic acid synthase [Clostridium botulinum]NFR13079.1 pseudaminic acid synthase [Clostridium botulinum]NFR42926.1 pseudaminic acid synthase [Clostridium botulinum]
MKTIKIGNKLISDNSRTFIIAEISANHNQDIEVAKKMIREAKKAGADAVKLQTYTADTITLDCDNEYFQIKQGTIWDGTTLHKLYQQAYTPWEWHKELMKVAKEEEIICFSSPFDKSAVDFLYDLNVPAYKVASFEITDLPLIKYIAEKGKPIIISTGIATIEEIQEAVQICKEVGNDEIILLKCTSAYPAKLEEMNLRTIPNMEETFGVLCGLSDHTLGITVPIGAIALGAKVVEKHFILDRNMGGPDSKFSLNINEFSQMVSSIRDMEKALGKVDYTLSKKALKNKEFSRSLFVVKDIKKGEKFTEDNIKSIRPGFGLKPKYLEKILGKTANKDLLKGSPMEWKYIK